jgi:hypothetical protein
MNGAVSRPSRMDARHSSHALTSAASGTGESHQKLPASNQRAMSRESRKGNHALTSPMKATTTSTSGRVRVRETSCMRPSVLRISHVEPSSA